MGVNLLDFDFHRSLAQRSCEKRSGKKERKTSVLGIYIHASLGTSPDVVAKQHPPGQVHVGEDQPRKGHANL